MFSSPPQNDDSSSTPNPSSSIQSRLIPPRSPFFRFIYKLFKYGTLLSTIVLIVLSGVLILGDTTYQLDQNREIFNLYNQQQEVKNIVKTVNEQLNKESSKFVSNNAVNLFVGQHSEQQPNINDQFDDLIHFTEFYLSQHYQNKNLLTLTLNINQQKPCCMIAESMTSKALTKLKSKVQKFIEKSKLIDQDQQPKQLTWNRVKKLVDGGKLKQLFDLVKDNLLYSIFQWSQSRPSAIVLIVNGEEQIVKKGQIQNKKALNKWIKQVDEKVQVFILSRHPLNNFYDQPQQDRLKSVQITSNINTLRQGQQLCSFFSKSSKLSQQQCAILKNRFSTVRQLQTFIQDNESLQFLSSKHNDQTQNLLQKVCQKGHVKYYFYENQQQVNKVFKRNKKIKKDRIDRQLQALLGKFSEFKKYLGINKVKDVFNTLSAQKSSKKQLNLQQANELGLLFDFDVHQLRWASQQQRIKYEIRAGKVCKGGQMIDLEIQEQKKSQEEDQKRQDEEQANEDEQTNVQDEQQIEEEYEQNYINWEAQKDKVHAQQAEQEQGQVEQDTSDDEQQVSQQVEIQNKVQIQEQNQPQAQQTNNKDDQTQQTMEQQKQLQNDQEQETDTQEEVNEEQKEDQSATQQSIVDDGVKQQDESNIQDQDTTFNQDESQQTVQQKSTEDQDQAGQAEQIQQPQEQKQTEDASADQQVQEDNENAIEAEPVNQSQNKQGSDDQATDDQAAAEKQNQKTQL